MGKYIFTLVLMCIGIASVSCDGRYRVYKSNTDILIENKLLDSFSENITYIPESYTEVVTDTILSNGFHIKMKTYSNMEKSVLYEFKQDTINFKEYHREFISEVIITKNSKEVFNKIVDKQFFEITENLHLKNSIVKLMVDESSSVKNNSMILSAMIQTTDSKKIRFYDIIIDAEGTYKLKEAKELYAYTN
ncbi:hypothetical protein [Xanthomarina sp. F2636L]|uniref:hypothetical protein n=1 Tax=Xanthomarina sp. F2636L TaxID=2996018 RepID=UPI00225E43AF|nr:hypothetical protein [Xanthomarina sp. F2636L]MCX7549424.1 hypothetical protein [Xanthomarina sp. F2636L]